MLTLRNTTEKNARPVSELMYEIYENVPEQQKDFFIPFTFKKTFSLCFSGPSCIYYDKDQPVGYLLCSTPGFTKKNIGYQIGIPEPDLKNIVQIESLGVKNGYRGMKLQKNMITYCEGLAMMKRRPCTFIATIHPDNEYSIKNFRDLGYILFDGPYNTDKINIYFKTTF